MILGMSTATYTFLHVLISLVGIGSGLIVMFGFLTARQLNGMTAIFLVTTVLTSVTGGRNSGALSISSYWCMALDLCGHRRHCALSQRLRFNRAAF